MGIFLFCTSVNNGLRLEVILRKKNIEIISIDSLSANLYIIKCSTTLRKYKDILKTYSHLNVTGSREVVPKLGSKIKKSKLINI